MACHLLETGRSYEAITDTLLTRTARDLGHRWDTDEISFADVTVGISRLFRVNAAFSSMMNEIVARPGPRLLFATLPCQRHTLGLVLAAESFRRDGWNVELRLRRAHPTLQTMSRTTAQASLA
jgi:hypothetical protein